MIPISHPIQYALCSIFVVAVATSCGSTTGPDSDPHLVGEVVATGQGLAFGDFFVIHIKETPSEECGVFVAVPDDAVITDSRGLGSRSSTKDALQVGAEVAVWITGTILDSCPRQALGLSIDRRR